MAESRHRRILILTTVATTALLMAEARAQSRFHGVARTPMIKGQPAAGYLNLYEFDLYVTPENDSFVGQARRTGTTIFTGSSCQNKWPPGGGDYCVDGLPAGKYSIYLNQPEFFTGHPKVVPDLVVAPGENREVNVELPVEYTTHVVCCAGDPWTWPQSAWYQTYTATGTSVTGVVFRIADGGGGPCAVSIHESNGNPNPTTWPQVGPTRTWPDAGSLGDNWVRWRSGEVPTTPGVQYAVRVAGINRNLQPLRRTKDWMSYQGGQAYDASGNPHEFDLDYMVFGDTDGTVMPVACRNPLKSFLNWQEQHWAPGWGQTWVATGSSLAAVDVWEKGRGCAEAWDMLFAWRVREGGPHGPQIGPTKITKPAWWGPEIGLQAVSYSPGEVPLTPGQTYFVEFLYAGGPPCGQPDFNIVVTNDPYPGGHAFQWNGTSWIAHTSIDLTMTLLEYEFLGPVIDLDPPDVTTQTRRDENPDPDPFTISNVGHESLQFTVASGASWLNVSPTGGTIAPGGSSPGQITYDVSGLDCGIYQATVQVADADPNAPTMPKEIAVTLIVRTLGPDLDCDHDVDLDDFARFQACYSGAGVTPTAACLEADFDGDGDVDAADLGILLNCLSGPGIPADLDCAP